MELKRVLIVGASSDIGKALLSNLVSPDKMIGAHFHRNRAGLERHLTKLGRGAKKIRLFGGDLRSDLTCRRLVDDFVSWADGIDALVQLSGDVSSPQPWDTLPENAWNADLAVNLSGPFFLARSAFKHMTSSGGRIVLTSTCSAAHGGGRDTLAYGIAKAGVQCLAKRLALDGAPHNILVNVVAPGLINTRFHSARLGRDAKAMKARAKLVPLQRAGRPEDVANMIAYLLSPGGSFITGEVISISGGDFL